MTIRYRFQRMSLRVKLARDRPLNTQIYKPIIEMLSISLPIGMRSIQNIETFGD